jgi:hypothetical protein
VEAQVPLVGPEPPEWCWGALSPSVSSTSLAPVRSKEDLLQRLLLRGEHAQDDPLGDGSPVQLGAPLGWHVHDDLIVGGFKRPAVGFLRGLEAWPLAGEARRYRDLASEVGCRKPRRHGTEPPSQNLTEGVGPIGRRACLETRQCCIVDM